MLVHNKKLVFCGVFDSVGDEPRKCIAGCSSEDTVLGGSYLEHNWNTQFWI